MLLGVTSGFLRGHFFGFFPKMGVIPIISGEKTWRISTFFDLYNSPIYIDISFHGAASHLGVIPIIRQLGPRFSYRVQGGAVQDLFDSDGLWILGLALGSVKPLWSSPIEPTLTNQCGHLATKIQVRIGLDMIRLIR